MQTFGMLLRFYRAGQGLSQSELARKAGLTYSAISRLEAGNRRPKRETVESLAKALELGPEEAKELFEKAGYAWKWEEQDKEAVLV
jgi:transcriptional regulator with XRE-family HTH domain